ncbi:MAG: DUF2805 domain-containing protein [Flavobacteriaceae bacterium]|jgi:uncharacterized protein (TIGR03643 family)
MKKRKLSELDKETIDRIIAIAQEEKRPFEAVKSEFGLREKDLTELMRKALSTDNFELWKKKTQAKKPKPKVILDELDEELDSKYYFKNKFD